MKTIKFTPKLKLNEIIREWTSRKKYKLFIELKNNILFISEKYKYFDPTKELKNRYRGWVIEADWYIQKFINYVLSRINFNRLKKKKWNWRYLIKF